MKRKLNYKKMIEDINEIVTDEYFFDVEMKLLPGGSDFTQEEAKEMINAITKVFMISHIISCNSCGREYDKLEKK